MKHTYIKGQKTMFIYKTMYGNIEMSIFTHEREVSYVTSEKELGINILLDYDLYLDNELTYRNKVEISLR